MILRPLSEKLPNLGSQQLNRYLGLLFVGAENLTNLGSLQLDSDLWVLGRCSSLRCWADSTAPCVICIFGKNKGNVHETEPDAWMIEEKTKKNGC